MLAQCWFSNIDPTLVDGSWLPGVLCYLWNSMTTTSFVFTELANTMKYGGRLLYNLVFTEWRHCVSQNEVWGRGVLYNLVFTEWHHCVSQNYVVVPVITRCVACMVDLIISTYICFIKILSLSSRHRVQNSSPDGSRGSSEKSVFMIERGRSTKYE